MESPEFYGLHNHHVITPAIIPHSSNNDTEYPPTAAEVPHLPNGLPHELGGSTNTHTAEPSGQNRAHMCINGHMADSSSFDNHPVDLSRGATKHPNGDLQHSAGQPGKGNATHLPNIHHPAAIKRERYPNEHPDRVISGGYQLHNGMPSGLNLSDRAHPGRIPDCE